MRTVSTMSVQTSTDVRIAHGVEIAHMMTEAAAIVPQPEQSEHKLANQNRAT
jgi:hypothetical protein